MSNDLLLSKIELLQEQVDNLEKSGFFTEAEMDKATVSLRCQIEFYKHILSINELGSEAIYAENSIDAFKMAVACWFSTKETMSSVISGCDLPKMVCTSNKIIPDFWMGNEEAEAMLFKDKKQV